MEFWKNHACEVWALEGNRLNMHIQLELKALSYQDGMWQVFNWKRTNIKLDTDWIIAGNGKDPAGIWLISHWILLHFQVIYWTGNYSSWKSFLFNTARNVTFFIWKFCTSLIFFPAPASQVLMVLATRMAVKTHSSSYLFRAIRVMHQCNVIAPQPSLCIDCKSKATPLVHACAFITTTLL